MPLNTVTLVTLVALATIPPDSTARREHVAITQDVAITLGIPLPLTDPYQIRVAVTAPIASAGNTANFSVVAILPGVNQIALYPSSKTSANVFRTDGGIHKLFASNTLPANTKVTLWNQAPSSTTVDGAAFGSSFTEPMAGKHFKEFVTTGSADLLIFAPHGGNIEVGTSTQLAAVKSRLNTLGVTPAVWDAQGTWGSNQTFQRWHITAPDINTVSFPGLDHLEDTYTTFPHAAALHGFSWDETVATKRGIVIGGDAPLADKLAVKAAIEAEVGAGIIAFYIGDDGGDLNFAGLDGSLATFSGVGGLRGTANDNLLNRISPNGGIQLEQSKGIRETALAADVALGLANALNNLVP